MARAFASALDDCLAALSQGESLESCLARYPSYAEELRTHLLLAQRLALTPKQQPRASAEAAAWQHFRSRVEEMRPGRRPSRPISIGWMRPLTIAAALLLALVGASGGTIYASQDALPDSPLYRVKLATEDARVWFTFDDSRKADLLLDQSNERTDEIMAMLRAGKPVPGNVLTVLRQRSAKAVRVLQDHPDELALLARAREQSAEQERLLLALWGDLSESAQDDYGEAVATLHNAQLRTTGIPGSLQPDDVAAGVINIAGTVEQTAEGVWLVGGSVEVRVDARTLGGADLEPGQAVNLIAARGANGRLTALTVLSAAQQEPEQAYVVSGALEDVSANEVVIAGQRIAITARTLLKLRLQRGQQVEIEVDDVDGQAVASSVAGPDGDDEAEAPTLLAYEGLIEDEISTAGVTNDWLVGGQKFTVTPSTVIDARAGPLAKGARARVEAAAENGEVTAKRVVILAAEPGKDDAVQVEGVLEQADQDSWTVSGVEVTAPADVAAPEVGSLVSLEGQRTGERVVTKKLFTTFQPGRGGLALLRGSIGQIGEDGSLRVGPVAVQIGAETVIRGELQVGTRVFIWGSRDEEGLLRAVYVNALDRKPLARQPASQD